MNNRLGIIPCTEKKIWDFIPNIGGVHAVCAYYGPEFLLSKELVSTYVDRIVIFSAKYGFLDPWDIIPESYDVTFSRENDPFIDIETLKEQASKKGLLDFSFIEAICNIHYQKRINDVFSHPDITIEYPLKNLFEDGEICIKINELLMSKSNKAF